MAKPKPKGWNSMSKAKQDAWKKANFDKSTKVTEAQLTKLRQAGTPTAAIAKYKNDPAMREALNRFYGKDRVSKAVGSSSSSSPALAGSKGPVRGGPGAKMRPRPAGGPGARTGKDGRSSTAVKKSSGPSVATQVGAALAATAVGGAGVRAITSAGKVKTEAKHKATKVVKTVGKHKATATKVAKTVGKHKATKVAGAVVGKTPLGRAVTVGLLLAGKGPKGKHKAPAKPKTKSSGKQA